MNISQFVILPHRWKLGQYKPNGFLITDSFRSLTHFFPFILTRAQIFTIPTHWRDLYGSLYINTGSAVILSSNQFSVSSPYCFYDGTSKIARSNPLSLILYY